MAAQALVKAEHHQFIVEKTNKQTNKQTNNQNKEKHHGEERSTLAHCSFYNTKRRKNGATKLDNLYKYNNFQK